MAEIQLGKGHIFSLSGSALSCAAFAAYSWTSPNLQNAELSHEGSAIEIRGQNSAITGLVLNDDDTLSMNFTVIPEGATKAAAIISSYIPIKGTPFGASGFPIIFVGKFTEASYGALNVNSGSRPWFYLGGASITGPFDGVWGLRLPMRRFYEITSGTPIA